MIMNYNIRKNRSFITNFITAMILLIIFTMALGMDNSALDINMNDRNIKYLFSILSITMYLMAIISSLYYYRLKKNSDIIFYLTYFILAFLSEIINEITWFNTQDKRLVTILYFIHKVLIIMTIIPNTKLKEKIVSNKIIFVVSTVLIYLTLSYFELKFLDNKFLVTSERMRYVYFWGNLINIYICGKYYKNFKKTKDYIYILLSVFLLIGAFRNIYISIFYNANIANNSCATLALLVMYINIIMYSGGLLLISNMDIKNKLKDMQDLDVFYNILDNGFSDKEMYFFNKDYEIIYANKTARKRFKIKENNLESFKTLSDRCEEAFKYVDENLQDTITKSVNKNKSWTGVINKGGYTDTLVDIKVQMSKDYGEIYVVQIDNNEEMINLRKEIDEKRTLFDIITEKSGDLISIVDKDLNIKYINDEAYKALGYAENEMMGCKVTNFLVGNNFTITDKNIFQELQIKCKNGNIIETETLGTPINDGGWLLVSRNITYRNQVKLLKEENENIKLQQQLRDDFFTNLSHELKTPLNIFNAIIQVLDLNANKSEKDFRMVYKKYNNGLKTNYYRMLRMITNLIDLTKFDSKSQQANFNNYDIVKLCEDITSSVITYAEQKNINITFDTNEEEHIVKCDGECMERIMLNLLSNAIKYTPMGGEIFVNLDFSDAYVYIKVKDNGIGIPKEKLNSIFEKFVRIDETLSRENEGSGIGLSIVKSLVDMLNGNIYIESKVNEGSEFTIEIPNVRFAEDVKDYDVREENITLELSDIYEVV